MKSELGFADAAVFGYGAESLEALQLVMSGDAELYAVIVGVEDSARIRTAGSETIDLPERWQPLKPEELDAADDRLLATMVTKCLPVAVARCDGPT